MSLYICHITLYHSTLSLFSTASCFIVSSHIFPSCHQPQSFAPLLSLSHRLCLVPTSSDIKEHVKQIEKAVSGKEPRFVLRALRALPSTSRRLNANVLHKALAGFYTSNATARDYLLGFLEEVRVWQERRYSLWAKGKGYTRAFIGCSAVCVIQFDSLDLI